MKQPNRPVPLWLAPFAYALLASPLMGQIPPIPPTPPSSGLTNPNLAGLAAQFQDLNTVLNYQTATQAQWSDAAARFADSMANLATSTQILLVEAAKQMVGDALGARIPDGVFGEGVKGAINEAIDALAAPLLEQARAARSTPGVDTQFEALVNGIADDAKAFVAQQLGKPGNLVRQEIVAAIDQAASSLIDAAGPSMRLATVFRDTAAVAVSVARGWEVANIRATGTLPGTSIILTDQRIVSQIVTQRPDLANQLNRPTTIITQGPSYQTGYSSMSGFGTGVTPAFTTPSHTGAPAITNTPTHSSAPTNTATIPFSVKIQQDGNFNYQNYQPANPAMSGGGPNYPTWDGGGAELSPAAVGLLAAAAFQTMGLLGMAEEPNQAQASDTLLCAAGAEDSPKGMNAPKTAQKTAAPTGSAQKKLEPGLPVPAAEAPLDSPLHWYLPKALGEGKPAQVCVPTAGLIHPDVPMRSFEYPDGKNKGTLVFAADSSRTHKPYTGAIATCTCTTNGARLEEVETLNGFLTYRFQSRPGGKSEAYYGLQWFAEIGPRAARITNPIIPSDVPCDPASRLIAIQVHSPNLSRCFEVLVEFLKLLGQGREGIEIQREEAPMFYLRDTVLEGTVLRAEIFHTRTASATAQATIRMWPKTYDAGRPASLVYRLPLHGGVNLLAVRLPTFPGACSIEVSPPSCPGQRSLAFLQREVVILDPGQTQLAESVGAESSPAGVLPLLGQWRGLSVSGTRPRIFVPFASSKRRLFDTADYSSLELIGEAPAPVSCSVRLIRHPDEIPQGGVAWKQQFPAGAIALSVPLSPWVKSGSEFLGAVLTLEPSGTTQAAVAIGTIGLRQRDPAANEFHARYGDFSFTFPAEWSVAVASLRVVSKLTGRFPLGVSLSDVDPEVLGSPAMLKEIFVQSTAPARPGAVGLRLSGASRPAAWNCGSSPLVASPAPGGSGWKMLIPFTANSEAACFVGPTAALPLHDRTPKTMPVELVFQENPPRALPLGDLPRDVLSAFGKPTATPASDVPLASPSIRPAGDLGEALVDFSNPRGESGALGVKNKSVARLVSHGEDPDPGHRRALLVAVDLSAQAEGAYGGAYLNLLSYRGAAADFKLADSLEFDARNDGSLPLEVLVELKRPGSTTAHATISANIPQGGAWTHLNIPLSQIAPETPGPCATLAFVVRNRSAARFEIANLRWLRKAPAR